MYYRIKTPEGFTPEIYRTLSDARYDARMMWDEGEYTIEPYTLLPRLELTLSRLWKVDPNGATCAMTDLYDGYDQATLADEIERTLEKIEE